MITISVPAKIHLLGEHVVVYGKPALLAAINRRVVVKIVPSKTKQIHGVQSHLPEIKQLIKILEEEIKKRTRIKKIEFYSISIDSQIPVRYGLGSSAALSAAFTAALLSFLEISWNKKIIFEIAYEGEKFFHGNPSGGDLAAVIEGGLLWFRKDFEFLKTFSPLPFTPHKNIKQFILINSGQPKESTKKLVEKAAQFRKLFFQKTEELFNLQENLTKQMVTALKEGNEDSLIECIKLGEKNLEGLGVVGKKTKSLIRKIEKLGGAAKISGGGGIKEGAGMLLAYHKNKDELIKCLKRKKIEFFDVEIEKNGLKKL